MTRSESKSDLPTSVSVCQHVNLSRSVYETHIVAGTVSNQQTLFGWFQWAEDGVKKTNKERPGIIKRDERKVKQGQALHWSYERGKQYIRPDLFSYCVHSIRGAVISQSAWTILLDRPKGEPMKLKQKWGKKEYTWEFVQFKLRKCLKFYTAMTHRNLHYQNILQKQQ